MDGQREVNEQNYWQLKQQLNWHSIVNRFRDCWLVNCKTYASQTLVWTGQLFLGISKRHHWPFSSLLLWTLYVRQSRRQRWVFIRVDVLKTEKHQKKILKNPSETNKKNQATIKGRWNSFPHFFFFFSFWKQRPKPIIIFGTTLFFCLPPRRVQFTFTTTTPNLPSFYLCWTTPSNDFFSVQRG